MTFADRVASSMASIPAILAAIQESGAEVVENVRPAGQKMFELCRVGRLSRYWPDYRFRWPETEWGLLDAKKSDLLELGAWITYMDLQELLGEVPVVVACPRGWTLVGDIAFADTPNGSFPKRTIRGKAWACPRLAEWRTEGGSNTPYSHPGESFQYESFARFGMLRTWLAKSAETIALEEAYGH